MKPYLLMVDADPVVRAIYRMYFDQCGFEVTTVGTALECLQMLDDSMPDVLVLDSNLPGGVAECILATLQDESITIPVVLTGPNSPEYRDNFGHGAFSLEKPFAMTQLHLYVREAMEGVEPVLDECLEALPA